MEGSAQMPLITVKDGHSPNFSQNSDRFIYLDGGGAAHVVDASQNTEIWRSPSGERYALAAIDKDGGAVALASQRAVHIFTLSDRKSRGGRRA